MKLLILSGAALAGALVLSSVEARATTPALPAVTHDATCQSATPLERTGGIGAASCSVPGGTAFVQTTPFAAAEASVDDKGLYRFSGLDPNVDYEIHAEQKDLISPTRTVSSFDSRSDIDMPLKLTKKKPTR